MKLYPYLAAATVSFSLTVSAQTERDLDSHEHGAATMNVALEGAAIFIELDTPWNNLVGFEHAPSTDEQRALVDAALAKLEQPTELFSFNSADCTATEMAIDNSMSDDEHHDDEHAHEEHDEHHDDEEHAHKDDDEHHDEEHAHKDDDEQHDEHHDDEEGSHSEVRASYSFTCEDVSKLSTIDVDLLTLWSNIEDLDVQMIGPGGQSSAELSPESISLDVSSIR
jgi:hypothetical protein